MNDLLQYLTTQAPAIIEGLLRFELRVAVLALLVLGIDLVLRRATPRFRYALWLVALVGVLWPPSLALSALDIWDRQPAIMETFGLLVLAPVATVNMAAEPGLTINWATLPLLLWGVMSASILILMTVNFVRFRLRLRPPHAQPWPYDEKVTATGQPWPPIWTTDQIHSPLTLSLLRPRIYLTWRAIKSGKAAVKAILYHELAHILRRDGWVSLLQAVALVIHPFNPLVWIMNARLARYREQLCDDFALEHAGMVPRDYGNILLDQLSQGKLPLLAVQTPTYFFETKRDLVHRLQQLMKRKEGMMNIITSPQRVLLAGLAAGLLFITSQCQEKNGSVSLSEAPTAATPAEADTKPVIRFIPYDEQPRPIGGYAAIQQHVVYPEEAKEAGVEGTVIVQAFVDENGQVQRTVVLKGIPNTGLDEAAMEAIRPVIWEPAKQKERPVGVWISIPVYFNLSGDEK